MKKLLGLTLSLASIVFVASNAQAADSKTSAGTSITASSSTVSQFRRQGIWGRRNNRVARVVTQTRLVRYGRRIFRETYQVRYLPNGRTQTRLISRVRVR
ncbi:MAG TPA: hypothetical protein VJS44_11555 [Pyrinomonadaceae bacterium]|nr:hypothetical protein [Pyrinomonadaceae bacterium]